MEELKEFKKELEEILEKVNAKLEESDKYWTVGCKGEIINVPDIGCDIDIFTKSTGNCFKTEKEAEDYLEDLKVKTEIKKIAEELNKGKEIDWNDYDVDKYYLYYDYGYNIQCIDTELSRAWKREGVTYCLERNFMDVCIERIGEERLKNYLKRN